MFKNTFDITKVLKEMDSASALLKNLLTDDVLAQMSDEQIEQIEEAIGESDPKKIKRKAEKLIKKYK